MQFYFKGVGYTLLPSRKVPIFPKTRQKHRCLACQEKEHSFLRERFSPGRSHLGFREGKGESSNPEVGSFGHASRSKKLSRARMKSFHGHSRGNSIRHAKSTAQGCLEELDFVVEFYTFQASASPFALSSNYVIECNSLG